MKLKNLVFYIITFLPLCLLLFFLFRFSSNVVHIKNLDYERIVCELENYLASDKAVISFNHGDDGLRIEYDYLIEDGPYKPKKINFVFNNKPDDYLIYVYGSSPLISRLPFLGEDSLFPDILESELNSGQPRNVRVYNFGVSSFDSFDIKEMVKGTVNYRKPDLIIYYGGHMDYSSAYSVVIRKNFTLLKGDFFKKLVGFSSLNKFDKWNKFAGIGDWILYTSIEPNLINLMQMAKIVSIRPEPFVDYNQLILSYYEKNINEIINFAREKNIPVIFITPIANLEVKPFGIYDITQGFFNLGMKESNYLKRIGYLFKARDSEIFTGDLRAKSGLNYFLRSLKRSGVYVLDLEAILLSNEFMFNYDSFYDVGHIRPGLHKIIADNIHGFIKTRKIIS